MPIAVLYFFLLSAELAYLFGDLAAASAHLAEAGSRLDRAFSIPSCCSGGSGPP